ncbi:MAG TPA: HNH endonuclease [Rhizomicrobium sp.]|jgi:hypothetical protein
MTPLERNRLLSVLNTNGFHAEVPTLENWVAADATFAPGRCYLTVRQQTDDYFAATSLDRVAGALAGEGCPLETCDTPPPAIAMGTFHATGDASLHRLVRRMYQLSLALPTAPLDRFVAMTRAMPTTTEAEKLVIQRVGQDIFRNALLEYWSGCCAVTGIDQPELLRASHCKPWAESNDSERLDVHNGLVLVADVDAAFDCGLISFDDLGAVISSERLGAAARSRFGDLHIRAPALLTGEHRAFLRWHRQHRFEG